MNLTIDIGNTTIHFGLFSATKIGGSLPVRQAGASGGQNKLLKSFKIRTGEPKLSFFIKKNVKISPRKIIICSVVPKETIRLKKTLKQIFKITPLVLGENLIVPIKNLYQNPKEVGQDRIVNAYAGIKFYGSPLIVIDFGTAITFDVISKNEEYLGGMILPGLNLSLDALNQKTALLPKVKLAKPKRLIGRNTKQSILSGIIYGFSAMTDNLVERIKLKIGKNTTVIATGGNAKLISNYCSSIKKIEENLILKGLNLLIK